MNQTIVDITLDNAQSLLIDESHKRLVVVDFWASWCEPCKTLMPLLEKLAQEYEGSFLLAKVNADDLQMLASQFGVRSLPTVMLIQSGQPVDGFVGAKSEQDIRALLEKYLPKPWDVQLERANVLIGTGDFDNAHTLLRDAYGASNRQANIAITLAQVLINLKRFDEAQKILDGVRLVDQDEFFTRILAQLDLARAAKKAPELEALEIQHAAKPEDLAIAFDLAVQYGQHAFYKEALTLLFEFLQKDRNAMEGEVKKKYLDILAVLGKGDPIAVEYQRKLYTLLY